MNDRSGETFRDGSDFAVAEKGQSISLLLSGLRDIVCSGQNVYSGPGFLAVHLGLTLTPHPASGDAVFASGCR